MSDRTPSSFTLWLEEALSGWLVHAVVAAIVVAAGAAYWAGVLSEGTTAALVAGGAGVVVGVLVLRPALATGADPLGRWLGIAAAIAAALLTALPAIGTVAPGEPAFAADLAAQGDAAPVPAGVAGPVRLLVRAPLPQGGMPVVGFRLAGTDRPVEGKLERTMGTARVGRGARTAVEYDHSALWLEAKLPASGGELKLDRLTGQPAGPLHVAVYPDRLPYGLLVGLCVLALLLAAVADGRLGGKHGAAPLAGMGLAFGLLVAGNATPQSALGTTLGGVVLGAMLGALAGWIAGFVVRPLVRPKDARRAS
jgi:hypothetical protein